MITNKNNIKFLIKLKKSSNINWNWFINKRLINTSNSNNNDINQKALVVWGTKICSSIDYKLSEKNVLVRNMFKLPFYFLSIFIEMLLLDAGFVTIFKKNITKNTPTNYGISFSASFINFRFY